MADGESQGPMSVSWVNAVPATAHSRSRGLARGLARGLINGLTLGLRSFITAPGVVLVALIRLYQRTVSPMLGEVCRYHPSCSRYAIGALSTHGAFKGSVLAARRLLRCTPLHAGGLDPVPPRGAWQPRIEPDGRVRA